MARKTTKFTIDSTAWSAVVVCHGAGCQWRGFAHTKPSAYRLLADHLRRCHDDERGADLATQSARRRGSASGRAA